MTTPALGIAYLIWLRVRWILIAAVVLTLAAAVAIRLVPAAAPYCQFAFVGLFFFALLPLFNACTLGPADLGARASGYPTHMFVLPVSSRSLVAWPMLIGALIFGGLWMLIAFFIFIPTDLPLPVVWPGMMLVAISVWLQSIAWCPFPSPYVRLPALVIGVAPLILVPLVTHLGMPPSDGEVPALVAWCVVWSFTAFLFGVVGLARARTSRGLDWNSTLFGKVASTLDIRLAPGRFTRPPFRSPAAAQFWHELRRNVATLPIMVAIVGVPMLGVLCLSTMAGQNRDGFVVGPVTISTAILPLFVWLGLPLLVATVSGAGLAKFDVWGKDEMPSFFAVRPMSSNQFICVKLTSIAAGTLVTWIVILTMFAVWAAIDASPLNSRDSVIRIALERATPQTVAAAGAVSLGLVVVMYRNIVTGMWASLFGRPWFNVAVSMSTIAVFVAVLSAAKWVFDHPDVQGPLRASLPGVLASLLAAKACGMLTLGICIRRRYSLSARRLATMYIAWLGGTALLVGITSCFLSLTWMVVAGIALFVPFTRLAIMPLALGLNRTR